MYLWTRKKKSPFNLEVTRIPEVNRSESGYPIPDTNPNHNPKLILLASFYVKEVVARGGVSRGTPGKKFANPMHCL